MPETIEALKENNPELCAAVDRFIRPKENPYRNKILSVQELYKAGEANLTENDIVNIEGVECYVLKVSKDRTKAEIITKDVYIQCFDIKNTTYSYGASPLKR